MDASNFHAMKMRTRLFIGQLNRQKSPRRRISITRITITDKGVGLNDRYFESSTFATLAMANIGGRDVGLDHAPPGRIERPLVRRIQRAASEVIPMSLVPTPTVEDAPAGSLQLLQKMVLSTPTGRPAKLQAQVAHSPAVLTAYTSLRAVLLRLIKMIIAALVFARNPRRQPARFMA